MGIRKVDLGVNCPFKSLLLNLLLCWVWSDQHIMVANVGRLQMDFTVQHMSPSQSADSISVTCGQHSANVTQPHFNTWCCRPHQVLYKTRTSTRGAGESINCRSLWFEIQKHHTFHAALPCKSQPLHCELPGKHKCPLLWFHHRCIESTSSATVESLDFALRSSSARATSRGNVSRH